VPPIPSATPHRIDGTIEYWRQFVWGCWLVTGSEADAMWTSLLSRLGERELEPWAENQVWMSAARYRAAVGAHDARWAEIARGRLDALLVAALDFTVDMRPISLLRLLGHVEPDGEAFARTWEQVEHAAEVAGSSGERQRCFGMLAGRADVVRLVRIPSVAKRIGAALCARNPFLVAAALRVVLASMDLLPRVEWLCRTELHRSLWSGEGVFWLRRLAVLPATEWRDAVVELLVDVALNRVGRADPVLDQHRLQALRNVDHLDPARSMDATATLIRHRALEIVHRRLRDDPQRFTGDGGRLLNDFIAAAAEVGGTTLGRAVDLVQDLEIRSVPVGPARWAGLAGALEAALTRAVTVSDAAWLLAGLATVPHAQRPPLDRFVADAERVLATPEATASAGNPIFAYLNAVSDGGAASEGGRAEDLATFVTQEIAIIEVAEATNTVRRLLSWAACATDEALAAVRDRVVFALAGGTSMHPPDGLAQVLADLMEPVLVLDEVPDDFAARVNDIRHRMHEATDAVDAAAAPHALALGVHLDDVLLAAEEETLGVPRLLPLFSEGTALPTGPAEFARLRRLLRLLKLRQTVGEADAVLHDLAKVHDVDELRRVRDDIRAEILRMARPAPQAFDEPWSEVYAAVVEMVTRAGWTDVEVVQAWSPRELFRRGEDALRVGARFDMTDIVTIVRNFVSNARQHGGGHPRVLVHATRLEVRSLLGAPLPPGFWTDMERWLNAGPAAVDPVSFVPRTGLRSARRAIRRNTFLRFEGESRQTLEDMEPADGEEAAEGARFDSRGAESVFTVSWQPTRPVRIA
jgi:hypothetical protein